MNPLVRQAIDFTEVYRRHRGADPATREAACLKAQFPAILGELRPDDLFAGRRSAAWITYVGPIWWTAYPGWNPERKEEGKQGGYCFDFAADTRHACTEAEREAIQGLKAFWERECSVARFLARWDDELIRHTGAGCQVAGRSGGFCLALDFDRLLRRGLPGLAADVRDRRARALSDGEDTAFCDGLLVALDVVADVCAHYSRQARGLAAAATTPGVRDRMATLANDLDALRERPPQTLHQAIQLLWLYNLLTNAKHVEGPRLDVALGDFYVRDLDGGTLTADQALDQILALWKLFHENGEAAVCRIVIGGLGRRNVAAADRFATAAIEASRRFRQVTPQLTLRIHRDQDPELLRQAYVAIGEGGIYPMLYNDDVVVPGVARALGVSLAEAMEYHPLGCGEYMLAHSSPSLLDSVWSIPKTVEAALHDGLGGDGRRIGPATGATASLDSFEELYAAVLRQVRFAASLAARTYRAVCDTYSNHCAFLLGSLLTDDCLDRNRAMFDGGVRLLGACEMGHGFTNAADALTAIRKLVYEDRTATLEEVVAALAADFEGHATLRQQLLHAPKFGNDDPDADAMLVRLWNDINMAARDAGRDAGLDFLLVSSVNPGGYGMGLSCGATADGRHSGQPFAIGNAPTAGNDRNGLTALCNSVARVDPANGGAVTNFKLSRELFAPTPRIVETVFATFFANGGQQASLTVVNRDDLEAAMREPAKYTHVLVRLGGWSARFVDLEPAIQQEILRRTLY